MKWLLLCLLLILPVSLGVEDSVNVKTFAGAKGNGRVALNCSMTASSATLTCVTSHFTTSDVGKKIVVYEAGPTSGTYRVPLTSTIASYTSGTQVALANNASATINPSTRVVWGTDDTVAFQAALDWLARSDGHGGNVGGVMTIPPGHYLVTQVVLPCAVIGVVDRASFNCRKSYNNIWIRGSGKGATTVENYNQGVTIGTGAETASIIDFGAYAEIPAISTAVNKRLHHTTISDFTMRQLPNTTAVAQCIHGYAHEDFEVRFMEFYGGSYECLVTGGGAKSRRSHIHHNIMFNGGESGLAYTNGTLAQYNLNGSEEFVHDNQCKGSVHCIEAGCVTCTFINNYMDMEGVKALDLTRAPIVGINIGSTSSGVRNFTLAHNEIRDYSGGITVGNNGIGMLDRGVIDSNILINSSISIAGGIDTNGVLEFPTADTVVHGVIELTNNRFKYDTTTSVGLPGTAITVGSLNNPPYGLESVLIKGNSLAHQYCYCTAQSTGGTATTQCTEQSQCPGGACRLASGMIQIADVGGGGRWAPSVVLTTTLTYRVPNIDNGYYYKVTTAGTTGTTEPTWCLSVGCTVTDNTVVWTNKGKRPHIMIESNAIMAPPGALHSDIEIVFRGEINRKLVQISSMWTNFDWRLNAQPPSDEWGPQDEFIPAGRPYSNTERYENLSRHSILNYDSSGLPESGYYTAGTRWNRTIPISGAGGLGWINTRTGYAGKAWTVATAKAFGKIVVPVTNNGHFYRQIVGAGCTTHASTEPTWPTSTGATVADNTCTWQESGVSVLWLAVP